MEKNEYTAFISYSHTDKKFADHLQKVLERYHIPISVRESNPTMPENLRPVFKDDTDMNPGRLSDRIIEALDRSQYLIVLCSKASAKSEWVNKEVEHFISTGRASHIIPVIIDAGTDSHSHTGDRLPEALRQLNKTDELLWINMPKADESMAVVKIIATLLNINFDTLWQRHLQEQRSNRRRKAIRWSVLTILLIGLLTFGIIQCNRVKDKEHAESQDKAASKAKEMIANGDLVGAIRFLWANDGSLLEPYNGKIDGALRTAVACYEAPGWKSIATDTLPLLQSATDIIGAEMDNTGKYCLAYTLNDFVVYTPGSKEPILHDKISPNCELFAIFTPDGQIYLQKNDSAWFVDPRTLARTETKKYDFENEDVAFTDISNDTGTSLAAVTDSALIECARKYDGCGYPTVVTANPKFAVAIQSDGVVRTFFHGGPDKTLILPTIRAMSYSGSRIAVVNGDNRIEIHNTLNNRTVSTINDFKLDNNDEYIMSFNDKSDRLTIASSTGNVVIMDVESGKEVSKRSFSKGYTSVDVSQDGKTVIFTGPDSCYYYCTLPDGEIEEISRIDGVQKVCSDYTGSMMATVNMKHNDALSVKIWDTRKGKTIKTFDVKCDLPNCESLTFDKDNEYLAMIMTTDMFDGPLVPMAQIIVISLRDGATVLKSHERPVHGQLSFIKFWEHGLATQVQAQNIDTSAAGGFLTWGKLSLIPWYDYKQLIGRAAELRKSSEQMSRRRRPSLRGVADAKACDTRDSGQT